MRYFPVPAALILLAAVLGVFSACASANTPPVAVVGDEIVTSVGYQVLLDSTGSSDPEDDELTFVWSIESSPEGSGARLSEPNAGTTSFTPDLVGEYLIALTVGDGKSWSLPAHTKVVAEPWFTKVTRDAKVLGGGPRKGSFINGEGPGAAWGDYDGDGDLDLYVTSDGFNKDAPATSMLYRNEGDGTFINVAAEAGVNASCNAYGSAWGDYDNDGDLDLYVVCHSEDVRAMFDHQPSEPNILYRNEGDGTFIDVAREAGVDYVGVGQGASWVDYDRDGNLDLYVANFGIHGQMVPEGRGDPNVLYRNNGDGTFSDVTEEAGVQGASGRFVLFRKSKELTRSGMTFGGLWFDFDNDGEIDLLECDDEGASPLYHNNGDGTFTDVTEAAGLYVYGSCMGVDAGDYDRDGDLDIYWTNFGPNYLWRNNGDGTFTEVAEEAGVADPMVGWATEFVDFDNDGLLDIYVVNGRIGPVMEERGRPWEEPNVLYLNNGDGTFTDVTALADFGDTAAGRGTAVGDYDNDGDLDFYVVNSNAPNILYRNEIGDENSWLKLRFEGDTSNRGGVGVVVKVDTGEWSLTEEVRTGPGFLAGNGPEFVCGLGKVAKVNRVTITWPSGISQTMTDVPVNQTITVKESEGN